MMPNTMVRSRAPQHQPLSLHSDSDEDICRICYEATPGVPLSHPW